MKLENIMNKGKKGLLTLLASGILAGCSSKYKIERVAETDFDKDGLVEVLGYIIDPAYDNPENLALVMVNGEDIENKNGYFWIPKDKRISVIQPHAKYYNEANIENVSVEDVNHDGWPDISYDMKIGNKKRKFYFNQGDGTLRGEI